MEATISRRGFVSAATGGLATATFACPVLASAGEEARPADISWDREADIVVIGYGGAGATAAITAHDAGAEVLIVEKMPQGGGNTAVSAGGFLCPDDEDDAFAYIMNLYELSQTPGDETLARVFSDMSVENVDWFRDLKDDVEMSVYGGAAFKNVEGADSIKKWGVAIEHEGSVTGRSGADLWDVYSYAVEQDRGIEVLLNTAAKRLLTDASGQVIGCLVEDAEGQKRIKARRAVVLTCGGFEYDEDMLKNNMRGWPIYAFGNPGNTGDGVRMAQTVGAGLWHMNITRSIPGFKSDDMVQAVIFNSMKPSTIMVNSSGVRFANELVASGAEAMFNFDDFDSKNLTYPNLPSWRVFDETTMQAGPVAGDRPMNDHKWSADNAAEVELGWIKKGDTVEELAAEMGVDPEALSSTVAKWNADVEAGLDSQFGRSMGSGANDAFKASTESVPLSAGLLTPPFYAIQQFPCLVNTQGGPRRDDRARVLNAFDEPIPRLYSAGELGAMWSRAYQGAGNNAESIVFGRIAGAEAAALENWDM